MIFFDGTYRLQAGIDGGHATSRRKSAYAWRVRIINLSLGRPDIRHIRPFIVFTSPAGNGIFKTNCAESMGKRIFRDFSLNMAETLWLELFPDTSGKIYAAVFTPRFTYGPEAYYDIGWRPIRPNELRTIAPFIAEIADLNIPDYH
ncbi:MAG: hypothetical protein AB1427_06050 [Thermodesulfobacteriota bacterium]